MDAIKGDNLQIVREFMKHPIVESECPSDENFLARIIGWTELVNMHARKARTEKAKLKSKETK